MTFLPVVVRGLAFLLLACGAAALASLVKGALVLRRIRAKEAPDSVFRLVSSTLLPPISLLVAPPGSTTASIALVRRLLGLQYGMFEVVVALDAPGDETLAAWTEEFHLGISARKSIGRLSAPEVRGIYESHDPIRLVVVDQKQGGTAGALNNGLNAAAFPLLGLVDPRSEFQPTLLLSLIEPLLDPQQGFSAACGIACEPAGRGWLAGFAGLEQIRLWLTRCAALSASGGLVPVPGAALIVPRDIIVAAGGFRSTMLELWLQLQALGRRAGRPLRTAFVAEAASLPEPATRPELDRSTAEDQAGIGSAFRSRGRIGGGFAGTGRTLASLFVARFIWPVAETAAYLLGAVAWWTGQIDTPLAGMLLLATVGTRILLSAAAVVMWDLARPGGTRPAVLAGLFAAALPENLGYRQWRNLRLIAAFFNR